MGGSREEGGSEPEKGELILSSPSLRLMTNRGDALRDAFTDQCGASLPENNKIRAGLVAFEEERWRETAACFATKPLRHVFWREVFLSDQ
ncbi:unnamed protein product [Chondrus crispus]|uniref:Uncharacterized protein n=1 Tax=Chondrus crispus TaxID=2769 RepID=R7QN58_CHOCR|nr:unnamed protein product [Chondrus crispus]CDF39509.1 unnamed protein product [Chondrus crispus]|eukprot:XP_005719420.1 unnamed protein product [Chondrus crispus]